MNLRKISSLTLTFFFAFIVMSCERNVSSVDVTITLPSRYHSKLVFDHLGRGKLVKKEESILVNEVIKVETTADDVKGNFNSVRPSFLPAADYPVNCYLVTVSGPEDDPEFTKNYCSKKIDPSQTLASDDTADKLYFGKYVGLIDAFNFGGTVSLSLKPGLGRTFTLLGFNSTTSCSEAFNAFKNKANLSKAFKLASSAKLDLLPGIPVSVDMQLAAEVDADDNYSDCVIQDPDTLFPQYQTGRIFKLGFPYKTFRTFVTTPTTNYYCEPLDIFLYATDPYTFRRVPATVAEDEYFSIRANLATVPTYESELKCEQDNSVLDELASNNFKISKNQIKTQRWFKQRRIGNSNLTMTLLSSQSELSSTSFFQTNSSTAVIVDNIFPEHVVVNSCYEAVLTFRDYKGYMIDNAANLSIINNRTPLSLIANTYSSSTDCETDANANQPLAMSIGQNYLSYYVKFTSDTITKFSYEIGVSGTTTTNAAPEVNVAAASTLLNTNEFVSVRVNSRSGLPNNPTVDAGKNDCFPIFVSLVRADETDYVQNSSSIFNILPLKVRVADPTGPNTNGYTLFSDNQCLTPVYPIGSTSSAVGTNVAAPAANSTFFKMYLKPDKAGTYGLRKLEFIYNDSPVGSYLFNLTNPLY